MEERFRPNTILPQTPLRVRLEILSSMPHVVVTIEISGKTLITKDGKYTVGSYYPASEQLHTDSLSQVIRSIIFNAGDVTHGGLRGNFKPERKRKKILTEQRKNLSELVEFMTDKEFMAKNDILMMVDFPDNPEFFTNMAKAGWGNSCISPYDS